MPPFLGLGANLGDRIAALQAAVDALAARGVLAIASSRVWATEPLGGPAGQPEFRNAVIAIDAGAADPLDVLAAANDVERDLGRVRDVRWGPRTIDIDLLLWNDRRIDEPRLTVPHPRLAERAFVVLPLLELPAPRGEAWPVTPPLALP